MSKAAELLRSSQSVLLVDRPSPEVPERLPGRAWQYT
jgi:hypothetical protein